MLPSNVRLCARTSAAAPMISGMTMCYTRQCAISVSVKNTPPENNIY